MTGAPICTLCDSPMSRDDIADPLFATVCKACTTVLVEEDTPLVEPVVDPQQLPLPGIEKGTSK